jgi:hypothetical protein
MKLPKAEQSLAEWQAATEALIMAAEGRGPVMQARIGMLRALNRHEQKSCLSLRKSATALALVPHVRITRVDGLQVIAAAKARLFALPFFLALFDGQPAARIAGSSGSPLGIFLLARSYTSVDVAINGQRRRCEGHRQPVNGQSRQKC